MGEPRAMFSFVIKQDGRTVATVDGHNEDRASAQAMHYVWQYMEDGPVELYRRDGRKIAMIATYEKARTALEEKK